MTRDLVSIIMPAFNGETYIQKAIESAIAQTHPIWELIVIDDGSTDRTADVVAAIKDSRIRYVYQENKGQAAALNHGLDLVQGEYITTLDVDDWLTPDSILARVNFLKQHPDFGAVYGDGFYCNVEGKFLKRFSEYRSTNFSGDVFDNLITNPFYGTGASVLVRRQIFDIHQIRYDESIVWCQDWDIYIRIAAETKYGVVDTPTVWYRLHEANMTMSMATRRRIDSLMRTRLKVIESPRFASVPLAPKRLFFLQLLHDELYSRLDEQRMVIGLPQFQALPKSEQARLLRLVADHYLSNNEYLDFAREWLNKAWALTPFNPKTASIAVLANLSPRLIQPLVKYWRQKNETPGESVSPLEMAKI